MLFLDYTLIIIFSFCYIIAAHMVDIMPENLLASSPVILFWHPSHTSNKISKNQRAYLVQGLSPVPKHHRRRIWPDVFYCCWEVVVTVLCGAASCSSHGLLVHFPTQTERCSFSPACPSVHVTHTAIIPKHMSAPSEGAANLSGTELKF